MSEQGRTPPRSDASAAGALPRRRRVSNRRQRGIGFAGILILAVLVIFFINVAITVVPTYTTFWQVRSIMDRLQQRPEVIKEGFRGVKRSLSSQFQVNSIRQPSVKDIKFEPDPRGMLMSLNYEIRKPLMFNVDVVMSFDHEVLLEKQ